eukprot:gene61407-83990_t
MLDPSTLTGLQMLNAEVTRQGAMVGYDNVFGWMAVAALLMLPMVLALGLSTALGAFIAGVMLADSPYRHELEADVEPFRSILLGLFFLAV